MNEYFDITPEQEQAEIEQIMRAVYPHGVPQYPQQAAPPLRLGRFSLPGEGLDAASLGVLQALQGARRPRSFGEGLLQGAIGGFAGARARGAERRQQFNEQQQQRQVRADEEAAGVRSRAALTLAQRRWELARQRAKELEETELLTPEMHARLKAQNVFIDESQIGKRIPRQQLYRDMPVRAERDPYLQEYTKLMIGRLREEAESGMLPWRVAQNTALNMIVDNMNTNKDVALFKVVRDQRNEGIKALGSGNSYGDLIALRMLAKATDPETGIREEEYDTFKNAMGLLARRGVEFGPGMVGEGMLTPKGRAYVAERLNSAYETRRAPFVKAMGFFNQQADYMGVPRRLLLNPDDMDAASDEWARADASVQATKAKPDSARTRP